MTTGLLMDRACFGAGMLNDVGAVRGQRDTVVASALETALETPSRFKAVLSTQYCMYRQVP